MDRPQIVSFLATLQNSFGLEALFICALVYLILLSIPFVPGVEIGLLIMATFGKDGVAAVYLATLGGLSLAYLFGYFFPQLWKGQTLQKLEPLTVKEQAQTTSHNLPKPLEFIFTLLPWILRYRYLTLALLINLPGNAIFGGGGGISFICGVSRKFCLWAFLLTLSIATLPVPLLVYFGFMELEKLFP